MPQRRRKSRKWSAEVTKNSNALDLEEGVFKGDDPTRIALSLKRSAERSDGRQASPFRSAMSMLTFYLNRSGKNLSASRKRTLDEAKAKLRQAFRRKPS